MGYHLGIDAGTTYTAAAVHRAGQVGIVPLGDRAASIPSVIFLKPDGSVLTGDAAYRRGLAEPERVALQFKRRIGDATSIVLGGTPYSAEALMAKLFRWTVDKVAALEGGPPETIAVTHPANWGDYKLDRLAQAIRMADLPGAVTLSEPEAAAVHYASNERVEAGSTIAVYDLGGGTFDAAVLRKDGDGWTILGTPEGIEQLGGIDIDEAVYDHVRRTVPDAFASLDPTVPATRTAIARLRRDCVEAKEALSSDTDVSIAVLLPDTQTQVRLTRSELESMIGPTLDDTIGAMERALRSAEVVPADVTAVLLVGGSSRIPMVAELVSSAFGRPVAVDAHPKHAIALGAALTAAGSTSAVVEPAAAPPPEPAPPDPAPAVPGPPVSGPPPEPTPAATPEPTEPVSPVEPDPEPVAPPPTPEPEPQPVTPAPTPEPEPVSEWAAPPSDPTPTTDATSAITPAPPPTAPVEPPDETPTQQLPTLDVDDIADEPDGRGNRLLLIGGAVALLVLAVAGGAWALVAGGDDDDGDGDAIGEGPEGGEGGQALPSIELVAGRTFPTGAFPDGIDVDHHGNLWVAITGADQVLRIDPATGLTDSVALPFGDGVGGENGPDPLAVLVDTDGFVWVSFRNVPTLVRIDPQALEVVGRVDVGAQPHALADGEDVLFVSTADGVDLVEVSRMEAVLRIDVPTPSGIAMNGPSAWVVSRGEGVVVEIDRGSFEPTGRSIPVGHQPDGIAVDIEGNLWVTNRGGGSVTWIDPDTEVTEIIEVGVNPADIVADDQGRVWLTDNGDGALVLIDPFVRQVAGGLQVGAGPLDLTVLDDMVFVSVSGDNVVQGVVAATEDPTIPATEITGIHVANDRYVVEFDPWNYEPDIGDIHTHFFWNTVPPAHAGVPEEGPWLVWGTDDPVDDPFFDVANRPDAATAICAVVANSDHTVADVDGNGFPDTDAGNCIRLPAADAADSPS